MLFNSLQFLIFFPAVVGLYFMLPQRARWAFLLVASYYFYMCWKPEYILLIAGSTLIDYYAGLKMGQHKEKSKRRKYLLLSLVVNIGVLFLFKYFNFFNENIRVLLHQFNIFYDAPTFKLLLPVGISFYTFQTLSYSIDVYRGDREPERHLGIFAVYVSYFPQLVAGPIERSTTLMPQFHESHQFDAQRASNGLRRIMWGMFMKVVVADRLAIYVDAVFNNPTHHGGLTNIVATIFFVFQIYCDFAGYSNIAIGTAQVMGYRLMENFRRPFFARSVSEFWQRWHISLMLWFRDYLYIPLGGNRVSKERWIFNTIFIFILCGFWHGAAWTFVITLTLHGFYIVLGDRLAPLNNRLVTASGLDRAPKLHDGLRMLMTFSLFAFSLIFFRAQSVGDALTIIRNFPAFDHGFFLGQPSTFIFSILAITILMTGDALVEFFPTSLDWFKRQHIVFRFASYAALTILVITIGVFDGGQFIYFQF